ncbi:MAG: response regulator [Hyphomicrobiales bacterium]
MSLADEIRALLPNARRFARALCGSQEEGDALVARALEAVSGNPSALDEGRARLGLYRLLVQMYGGGRTNPSPGRLSPDRQMQRLTPACRQAYLLMNVESFTRGDTAQILGVGPAEVDRLLGEAQAEMASGPARDVLIIEDEPLIAMDLNELAHELGHRVTAIARTRSEAVAAVGRKRPDIILADIELADGSSGVDAINDIVRGYEVPAIFVTAYPERALKGVKAEPTFLMTKPFRPEVLKAMISQALYFEQKAGISGS